MFKIANSFDEIAASMETNLVSVAVEQRDAGINKFAVAMDRLCSVAEMFDELGLSKEAEAATMLLEIIAKKKSKKPVKSKNKSKSKSKGKSTMHKNKDLTPELMIENLKGKGWVFNESCNDADDGGIEDFNLALDFDFNEVKEDKKHTHGCMCSECMNEFNHGEDCICQDCFDNSNEVVMNSDDMFYADDESNDEKELAKMFEKLVGPVAIEKPENKRRHSSLTMIPAMTPEAILKAKQDKGLAEHRDEEYMEPFHKAMQFYFEGGGEDSKGNRSTVNDDKRTIAPPKRNHRF